MTYARLCEHKQLRSHEVHCGSSNCLIPQDHEWCKGGEFLPEGALVIEKESIPDGGGSDYVGEYYPRWACDALETLLRKRGCYPPLGPTRQRFVGAEEILDALFDALASQVGESE